MENPFLIMIGGGLLLCCHISVAAGNGWRWYDDPVNPAPNKPPTIIRTVTTATPIHHHTAKAKTPSEQLKAIQEKYHNAKAQAVMHPTVKNAILVMKWHQYFLKKSDEFGTSFKKALLVDPTLSYRAKYPLESIARQTYSEKQHQTERNVVAALQKEGVGLVFVYRGHNAFAETLAPSLQEQANAWHMPLMGVSNDGVMLSSIKHNRLNHGDWDAPVTPAIYLFDPKTHIKKAIAFGFISMTELTEHLTQVATNYKKE